MRKIGREITYCLSVCVCTFSDALQHNFVLCNQVRREEEEGRQKKDYYHQGGHVISSLLKEALTLFVYTCVCVCVFFLHYLPV